MESLRSQHAQRLERWSQTPATRLSAAAAAVPLIQRVGIATLFPASPEVPNLYHAYMGDPTAPTDSKWDSPSGEVYTWRWILGRQRAAFYTACVRGRPTWVSWEVLPAMLRVRGEMRTPDELYDAGELSRGAYRVAQALEAAGGVLTTSALREAAGFPKGTEQRAAFLKAVDELDNRLLLAKVFAHDDPDDLDMRHTLVATRYPDHLHAAEQMAREDAMDQLLATYLAQAVYALPVPLAKHLKLPEHELRAGLDRLVAADRARPVAFAEHKGTCYCTV